MNFISSFRFVHNRKKKLNSKGQAPIQLEASYRSIRKFISTGVFIKPTEWNGYKIVRHKDSVYLNKQLDKIIDRCKRYAETVDEFFLQGLENYLESGSPENFTEFFTDYLNSKKDIEPSTYRQYNASLEHRKDFGTIQSFTNLTYENIFKFDQYSTFKGLASQTRRSFTNGLKWSQITPI